MTRSHSINYLLAVCVFALTAAMPSCKNKKKTQKTQETAIVTDTTDSKCKLDFKNAKALTKYVKENEFSYEWINAKANVESLVEGEENSLVARLRCKKDSAIFITLEKLSIDVAKILITKDSVKMRIDLKKQYFIGDFKYINEMLNADLDFNVLQAVLFGNSAEFHGDSTKLKAVTDRTNCHYMLSTERKRRLRRIQQGESELRKALQTLILNPETFKIIRNEFIDPATNRTFTANYRNFTQKDSVYAPYNVDIDIVAEKKATVKIEYVRIEKNVPQKLELNIPSKYDRIELQKKPN